MSEEKILSLAEFHKDHKDKTIYSNVQGLIDDATHIYNKLKTPKAIVDFYNNKSYEEQIAIVPEIEKSNHSGGSFYEVCGMAYHYAKYVTKSAEKHNVPPKHILYINQHTRS